ncbi:hypothetical protein [Nonomuraea sp. NPDC049309]|uniref:hypothetical protein n=1 Tax=Nonomuraea sp. NPDC049309 TaxID=3364350 RepID=UPI00371DFEBB
MFIAVTLLAAAVVGAMVWWLRRGTGDGAAEGGFEVDRTWGLLPPGVEAAFVEGLRAYHDSGSALRVHDELEVLVACDPPRSISLPLLAEAFAARGDAALHDPQGTVAELMAELAAAERPGVLHLRGEWPAAGLDAADGGPDDGGGAPEGADGLDAERFASAVARTVRELVAAATGTPGTAADAVAVDAGAAAADAAVSGAAAADTAVTAEASTGGTAAADTAVTGEVSTGGTAAAEPAVTAEASAGGTAVVDSVGEGLVAAAPEEPVPWAVDAKLGALHVRVPALPRATGTGERTHVNGTPVKPLPALRGAAREPEAARDMAAGVAPDRANTLMLDLVRVLDRYRAVRERRPAAPAGEVLREAVTGLIAAGGPGVTWAHPPTRAQRRLLQGGSPEPS